MITAMTALKTVPNTITPAPNTSVTGSIWSTTGRRCRIPAGPAAALEQHRDDEAEQQQHENAAGPENADENRVAYAARRLVRRDQAGLRLPSAEWHPCRVILGAPCHPEPRSAGGAAYYWDGTGVDAAEYCSPEQTRRGGQGPPLPNAVQDQLVQTPCRRPSRRSPRPS